MSIQPYCVQTVVGRSGGEDVPGGPKCDWLLFFGVSQGHVVMGNNAVSPYQQVIEKTKSLSFRSQMLAMNIEKKQAYNNRNEVSERTYCTHCTYTNHCLVAEGNPPLCHQYARRST